MNLEPDGTSAKVSWTVGALIHWTEGYFRRLQFPAPRLDAEILLAHALDCSRVQLYTDYHKLVEPAERARFRGFVERRAAKEPVAYICGRREFYSLSFDVSPAVLVPRPETEHLVDVALEEIAKYDLDRERRSNSSSVRVLDLGTGSGNVAVAIAFHAPHVLVDAADISPEALAIAHRNASAHGVDSRVRFFEGDALGALPPGGPRYHVLVSNPPYIPVGEYETLMDDVRLHEPRAALVDLKSATGDGLGHYRAIAAGAASHLEEGGLVAVEVGMGQAGEVARVFALAGWQLQRIVTDYGGIERIVAVRRAGRGDSEPEPLGGNRTGRQESAGTEY